MKKKIKAKRLTLGKETVRLLENGNLKNLVVGAESNNTCAYLVGDPGSWPGRCFRVQCA